MFASKKVVNQLLKTLGLEKDGTQAKEKENASNLCANSWRNMLLGINKEINPPCSSASIKEIKKEIKEEISQLNKKLNLLFNYLGIEYQKECNENLPKIIKIRKKF
jgi:hypothetical protein